jgi:thiamine pyrophosphate-dependent acetolactate synthase large subunit-like protein
VIFGSSSLSSEACDLHRPGYFYVEDSPGFTLSVALGIAMGTDKRVFVFLGEGDLLRNFGALNQMSAARKQNLFVMILNNGCYQAAGGFPNIFNSVLSITSLVFNIGCRVFDLTSDFEKKRFAAIKYFFGRGQGPMVVLVRVEKSKESTLIPKNNLEEFITFVRDTSIKTALYNPFAEGFILPTQEDAPILNV